MWHLLVIEAEPKIHCLLEQVFFEHQDFLEKSPCVAHLRFIGLREIDQIIEAKYPVDAIIYSVNEKSIVKDFLKVKNCYSNKPILVLDVLNSTERNKAYLNLGAADYLVSGVSSAPLIRKSVKDNIEKQHFIDKIFELEQRVEELKSRNDLVSKFAALGEITANIAHEINTPLSTILINVEYIQSDLKEESIDKKNIDKMLSTISRTSFRIAEIVKTLRDFARRKDDEKQALVSLDTIIKDALDLFSIKAKSSHLDVKYKSSDDELTVSGYFIELFLVLINLLNNSLEAIIGQTNPWIQIKLYAENKRALISVTDSGLGVPASIQTQIFEPFFTTKTGQGIGLGLNISEKIIRRHGGMLYLDKDHSNTQFKIELPLVLHQETQI